MSRTIHVLLCVRNALLISSGHKDKFKTSDAGSYRVTVKILPLPFRLFVLATVLLAGGRQGARLAIVPQESHQPIWRRLHQDFVERWLMGSRDWEGRARECRFRDGASGLL